MFNRTPKSSATTVDAYIFDADDESTTENTTRAKVKFAALIVAGAAAGVAAKYLVAKQLDAFSA